MRAAYPGVALLAGAQALLGCGGESPSSTPDTETLGRARQAFINGQDDRREFYELTDDRDRALMEQSIVALVPDAAARPIAQGKLGDVPTWGELNHLCPGQPFVDQPSAAF